MQQKTKSKAILILAIASAIALISFAASRFTTSPQIIRFLDNLHWTVTFAAAAALGWIGLKDADEIERPARLWFTRGLIAYAFGQMLWDIQVALGWNPFPAPSDLFYLCLGPCFAMGLLKDFRSRVDESELRSAMLDTLSFTFAVISLALAFYLPRRGDTGDFKLAVMVAYPVGMLAAASIGSIFVLNMGFGRNRLWLLLLGGLCADGIIWMRWNSMTLDNVLEDGTLLNFAFSPISLMVGLGAMVWRIEKSDSENSTHAADAVLLLLPLVLVMVAVISIIAVLTLPDVPKIVELTTYAGAFAVIVMSVVRQSFLLTERSKLLEAEQRVRETGERYRALFESAQDSIILFDGKAIVDCNHSAPKMFGCTRDQLLGKSPIDFSPEFQPDGSHSAKKALEKLDGAFNGRSEVFEWQHKRLDGTPFDVELRLSRINWGGQIMIQGIVRDVTELRKLEQQLFQAQKMESLGTLAGGIAHDFNNILTIITGYAESLHFSINDKNKIAEKIEVIKSTTRRGAGLVNQLLMFARKTDPEKRPLQINEIVTDFVTMIRETFPKTIAIETRLAEELPEILSDPVQINQVLLNLCFNARDAMPAGGKITISSHRAAKKELPANRRDDSSDLDFICISVSDCGCGIDERLRARVFEPFYSTKEVGKGTGLGLAVVFGIVENHSGFIDLETEVGVGTTVKLFLPIQLGRNPLVETFPPSGLPGPGGTETVLLVEDEEMLNELMTTVLESKGYTVISARDGQEAIEKYQAHSKDVAVVLSDYGLPKKSGGEVLRHLKAVNYEVKVIIATGYIEPEVKASLSSEGVKDWIQKPYLLDEALLKVRQVIDL